MNYTNPCGFCADDRLVQLLSCSFSGAVTPIYGALFNGAALLPYDVHRYGIAPLARWLIDNDITVFIGGSVFRALVTSLHTTTPFPHLRLLYCGAEALYKHDVALYRPHDSPTLCAGEQSGGDRDENFSPVFYRSHDPGGHGQRAGRLCGAGQ